MEYLNEMLALPFRVKPVAVFDNKFTLYSSPRLKEKFARMLSKEKLTRSVSPKLSKLILDKKIVPAFVSKGMLRYLSSKLLGFPMKGVAGFYTPKKRKIYVIVDTNSNIFGFTSDKILSYTTLHESMHMSANLKPSNFWSLFKEPITTYYNSLYSICLGIEPGIKFDSVPIRDFLWNNFERGWKKVSKSTIIDYGEVLKKYKDLSYLRPESFDKVVERIQFITIATIWKPNTIQSMYYRKDYSNLFRALYDSYKSLGIKKAYKYTFAYQEFVIPSEVICIQAIKPNSKNYTAVNLL